MTDEQKAELIAAIPARARREPILGFLVAAWRMGFAAGRISK